MKNIVLIDFTPQSLSALKYAVETVKKIENATLELINVSDVTELSSSNHKLQELKNKYSTPNFTIETKELAGDLMDVLPEYINSKKTGFVICATHDMKFLERLFSSRALKLMHEIKSNFIFIPESITTIKTPKHILLPVISDKHSLQKLEPLLFLKHFLNFEITLCTYGGKEKDQVDNLYTATKILNNANVSFSTAYIGKSESELLDKLEELAISVDADAISIMDFTENNIFNFGAKGFVEKLIRNNNGLEVFIIGNKQLESYSGFHTSGGY